MGKIKSMVEALIVKEKENAKGSTFRTGELHSKEAVESGPSTDFWYTELKHARENFRKCSRRQVELLNNVYRGDQHRHHVFHTECGHHSWTSLRDLQALPPEKFCPHCHGTDNLARFGNIGNLQIAVYRMSSGNTYFYASNLLGEAEEEYHFFCGRHGRSYRATWSFFWNAAGKTNGCPICAGSTERKGE